MYFLEILQMSEMYKKRINAGLRRAKANDNTLSPAPNYKQSARADWLADARRKQAQRNKAYTADKHRITAMISLDDWQVISDYMDKHNITNITRFVRDCILYYIDNNDDD